MSFLDKLKSKSDNAGNKAEEKREEVKIPADLAQLDVDIYENSSEIIIYAPVPGSTIEDLDISVEDEGDVVTIQGKKTLPAEEKKDEKDQALRTECHWGGFFRQIILPQEININEVDAKLSRGVLILRLPLLKITGKGKKKISIKGEKGEKGGAKDNS